MAELKHSTAEHTHVIDPCLIKHCLQNGNLKKALYYCQLLLAENPNQIEVLLFAAIASRGLGDADKDNQYASMAQRSRQKTRHLIACLVTSC